IHAALVGGLGQGPGCGLARYPVRRRDLVPDRCPLWSAGRAGAVLADPPVESRPQGASVRAAAHRRLRRRRHRADLDRAHAGRDRRASERGDRGGRHARLRRRPVYRPFDIDAVDPAFAPGTGTPEVGGLTSYEALVLVRALAGQALVGADVVEVSPPYDGPGQITALLGANLLFELVSVLALQK